MKIQKPKVLQHFLNSIIGYRESTVCNILVNESIFLYIGIPSICPSKQDNWAATLFL